MALETNRAYEVVRSRLGSHQDSGRFSSTNGGEPRSRVKRRPLQLGRPRIDERECRLKTLLLRVGDLGLGYDSEESVLFKYCGGGCPRSRNNHDLTLSRLLQKSDHPSLVEDKIFGGPCCRPTHFEDVAFLDDRHRWHTVEQLSAAACGCVG
ncbi:persephin [Spea bombifrons]|uniref:persephin n=1 Tax=Spea bombifrons TaxID=233779 RepID=UPI00234AF777|nr:persephin [Spea bombifrons]